ncbi:hypothetical protein XENOCAPTIV_004893, partial [Xenoophorus captivus]
QAKGQDACSIPCDITVKLLRDEKHSICGEVMELMSKVQLLSSEVQRSNSEMYSIKPVQSHGDAFRGYDQEQNQDTAPFSASDVDNDGCNPSCSFANRTVESCSILHNHTGWWFNQCGLANLNGSPEDGDQNQGRRTHILWDTWRQSGIPYTIKSVTMKIRRLATNN